MIASDGQLDVWWDWKEFFMIGALPPNETVDFTNAAEQSDNRIVSVEIPTTAETLLTAANDLVIGRAAEKMILAELSAEDFSSNNASNSSEDRSKENLTGVSTETTPHLPQFEFLPQFEHSSYDFMVPEGSNPASTVLAVISYLGRKNQPMPIFKISFDRMRWFEIGDVIKKELDNYVEYQVTINQRAEVYVQYSLTKHGSYKFSIEVSYYCKTVGLSANRH
ncbi:unnamed protein product [Strongylus vulgaris]|uniref:Uncharacterized protein n=1 Tax=Strongylus vulgaris TaxID=40348 RepID=A0A3P7JC35_STRVU|nr:unnamed protein product [Strongylus vulgaris]